MRADLAGQGAQMKPFSVQMSAAERADSFCEAFVGGRRPRFLFGRNKYAISVSELVDVDGFVDDFTTDTSFHGRCAVSARRAAGCCALAGRVTLRRCGPLECIRNLSDEVTGDHPGLPEVLGGQVAG